VQAVVIRAHGGPEVLEREAWPEPEPRPGERVVEVTHVGLNHLDVWVRRGVPGHDFHLPRVPGSDVVGRVDGQRVALHPSWGCGTCAACLAGRQNRCRRFRIRGESADGGACERLAVPEWQLLPVPDHLSDAEAAALPLALLTAWHMLHARAGIQRGERVLVQAGASGVGVMAIQVARLAGCEVHATASSEAKRAAIAALGAQVWPTDRVGVRDVDVVVESVGAPTWASSVRALRWGGRLVCCGATAGAAVPLDLRTLFFKQLDVLGSTMGTSADMLAAWAAVREGAIRPLVHAEGRLSRLGEAHAYLERREVIGKVVCRQDLADA
jgi:NADPH:quinone reductase-like Zn-dependent oxidoreductase